MNATSQHPHLRRAPIVEALLDIRTTSSSKLELDGLSRFHERVKERFPSREERRIEQIHLSVTGDKSTQFSRTGEINGYLCRSNASKKVVQARVDGFAFSKLKPYETWGLLKEEAHELWGIYREVANPQSVSRIALRYINRMPLPLPLDDFSEYLCTFPQIAPELPQALANFVLRMVVPKPDSNAVAVIHETFEQPTKNNELPFILDIDVFMNQQYDPADDSIWDAFEQLRSFKNDWFFRSTTERAQELFK